MMKFGIVGIGNIANKAYLPTYLGHQGEHTFYFATRNEAMQNHLHHLYGLTNVYKTIDELLAQDIDACFIHAATDVHAQVVETCLNAGVHVFVDKPLSTNYQEVIQLHKLAQEKKRILMIGFNRRFAPMTTTLKKLEDKRMIHLQKNRVAAKEMTGFVLYDLFLHLIDTAIYLLDDPIVSIHPIVKAHEGYLEWISLQFETANSVATLTMDLKSGANSEVYQVTTQAGTYTVTDLQTITTQTKLGQQVQTFDDWTSTLAKRGFEQMVVAFIAAVSGKEVDLKQEGVVISHEICEKILRKFERHSI